MSRNRRLSGDGRCMEGRPGRSGSADPSRALAGRLGPRRLLERTGLPRPVSGRFRTWWPARKRPASCRRSGPRVSSGRRLRATAGIPPGPAARPRPERGAVPPGWAVLAPAELPACSRLPAWRSQPSRRSWLRARSGLWTRSRHRWLSAAGSRADRARREPAPVRRPAAGGRLGGADDPSLGRYVRAEGTGTAGGGGPHTHPSAGCHGPSATSRWCRGPRRGPRRGPECRRGGRPGRGHGAWRARRPVGRAGERGRCRPAVAGTSRGPVSAGTASSGRAAPR